MLACRVVDHSDTRDIRPDPVHCWHSTPTWHPRPYSTTAPQPLRLLVSSSSLNPPFNLFLLAGGTRFPERPIAPMQSWSVQLRHELNCRRKGRSGEPFTPSTFERGDYAKYVPVR